MNIRQKTIIHQFNMMLFHKRKKKESTSTKTQNEIFSMLEF
jgi:hypothetical protein